MFALREKTVDYVLKADKGETNPPVFKIKSLTVAEQDRLADMSKIEIVDKRPVSANLFEVATATIRAGLIGWSNFFYADGTECKFDTDMDKNLSALPIEARFELKEAINELSYPTEGELKNSNSPLSGSAQTHGTKSGKRNK
jgi:hypothetical protein